jgi:hypothetical protein
MASLLLFLVAAMTAKNSDPVSCYWPFRFLILIFAMELVKGFVFRCNWVEYQCRRQEQLVEKELHQFLRQFRSAYNYPTTRDEIEYETR